jgi:hypothetical protein
LPAFSITRMEAVTSNQLEIILEGPEARQIARAAVGRGDRNRPMRLPRCQASGRLPDP